MDKIESLQQQVREMIAKAETKEAVRMLKAALLPKGNGALNGMTTLESEMNRLTSKEILNSISEDQLNVMMNNFHYRFLQFLDSLADADLLPEPQSQVPTKRSLPKEFRLAVISARKPAALKIQRLFKLAGIQPVDLFYHPVDWTAVDLHPYTLVIFDNQDLAECPKDFLLAKLSQEEQALILARIEEMETYLSMYEDKFILHFGDFLYWINQTRDRVHPANSKFSLYARTMEALDFIQAFQV